MIKFFRKIRHKLVVDNKFTKYLLYAIGEIVLVVIGILIALQINTWNDNRNSKTKEIEILRKLNVDLNNNRDELLSVVYYIKKSNAAGKKILEHLKNSQKTTDSLKLWAELFPLSDIFNNANTTYKNVENSNENIISNDSLRLKITLIYERDFQNVHKREKRAVENKLYEYREEAGKYFKTGKAFFKFIEATELAINTPTNFPQLKTSESYKNALVELYNCRLLRLFQLKKTMKRLDALIKEIDDEISRLIQE